jgi:hypothetical protein
MVPQLIDVVKDLNAPTKAEAGVVAISLDT